MVINRTPYNKPYTPTKEAIEYFTWFNMFFEEENKTPPSHFQLIDHINSRYKRKGVMCHRGFGKTTLMRYNLLYWLFKARKPNFGEFDYILLIQDTVDMVASTIDTLSYLIEDTELSNYLEIKKKNLGDNPVLWVYNKEKDKMMYIRGKGSGQAIRGINIRGKRPNIIILDDIEDENKQTTKESRDKLKWWFYNAVAPAVNKNKYEMIIIGTPTHEDSLLMELYHNSKWAFIELPVCEKFPVLNKNEIISSWPDRFTPDEILGTYEELKENGRELSFWQEYMLKVVPRDNLLYDMNKINYFKLEDLKKFVHSLTFYVSVDLAVSEKDYADYTAISVIGINENNDWFLVDGFFGRVKPDETIEQIFKFVTRWRPYAVVMEQIGLQLAFDTFLKKEMIKRGKFFNIEKVKRTNSKLAVLKGFQPIVEMGKFWLPEDYLKDFVDELKSEMSMITNEAIKAKHDDLIDSIAQLTLTDTVYVGSMFVDEEDDDEFSFLKQREYKNPYIF